LQDTSLDFQELGVAKGWVVINASNDNRGLVDEVQRPSGQSRYCRVTIQDVSAADFDDDDICFLIPPEVEQITAITAMS
jgi:hypothetical protein